MNQLNNVENVLIKIKFSLKKSLVYVSSKVEILDNSTALRASDSAVLFNKFCFFFVF